MNCYLCVRKGPVKFGAPCKTRTCDLLVRSLSQVAPDRATSRQLKDEAASSCRLVPSHPQKDAHEMHTARSRCADERRERLNPEHLVQRWYRERATVCVSNDRPERVSRSRPAESGEDRK